jgi:RimK-like ATP-grasp domain
MRIFVHEDTRYGDRWHHRYIEVLSERYGIETVLVDFLRVPLAEIAPRVQRRDGLIARWGHLSDDLDGIRPIFNNLTSLFGGRIFPSPTSYLYYDDKARQASLFLNRGYPIPPTAVVSSPEELTAFLERESLSLPIVVKDAHGACSTNVRLLPQLADATYPCIAQRFCPGNTCDYRLYVIGHRVMGFIRVNRRDDFRASGSGRIVYVDNLDPALVALAARISSENNFDSMAYDFVRLGPAWVLLEISYTYVDRAVRDCAWYYDIRTGEQIPKIGIYPQDFIVEDFLARHYPEVLQTAGTQTTVAVSMP